MCSSVFYALLILISVSSGELNLFETVTGNIKK